MSFIRSYRNKHSNVLLLDSGGYMGLFDVEQKGSLVLLLMEIMQYDTWSLGDQELYHGLNRFLERFGSYDYFITNASLYTDTGESVFTPYRIFTVGSIKCGVIGLMGPETFRLFPQENHDFTVEDPTSTLQRLLPELQRSTDYIIVLSQLGSNADEVIASQWPEIDLIIGGHSQTLMENARIIGDCRIVQAGKGGGRVGELVVTWDSTKTVNDVSYSLINMTDKYQVPPDIQLLLDTTLPAKGN